MKTGKLASVAAALALVAGCIFVAGCIPSLNPFYSEQDIVFDPRLLGEWHTKGDTNDVQTWKFEEAETNAYSLVITNKGSKQGKLDAHLFKLDGQLFLDLIPSECKYDSDQADIIAASMFPGHLLLRVPQLEPTLQIAYCDYDWLSKYLEVHPDALPHHKEQNSVVLTPQTGALQAFVIQHLNELFQKPEEFERAPTR